MLYTAALSALRYITLHKKVSKQLLLLMLHVARKLPMYHNHNVYSSSTTHPKGSCYKTELYLSGLTVVLFLKLHCTFLFHLPLKNARARACVCVVAAWLHSWRAQDCEHRVESPAKLSIGKCPVHLILNFKWAIAIAGAWMKVCQWYWKAFLFVWASLPPFCLFLFSH